MVGTHRAGDKAKDAVLAQLESQHAAKMLLVRHRFAEQLLTKGFGSLNDLDLPPDLRGCFLGSIHKQFVSMGAIAERGLVRSTRPGTHSRRIAEYATVDYEKLREWVTANPLPTPGPELQKQLPFLGNEGA